MFVYHFVDPDLKVEAFFEKDGPVENGDVDFEIGNIGTFARLYHFMQSLCRFLLFFGDKKIAFKSSLGLYFHPLLLSSESMINHVVRPHD